MTDETPLAYWELANWERDLILAAADRRPNNAQLPPAGEPGSKAGVEANPQVDAVLACLPVRDDGMVSIGEVENGGRIWTTLVQARPLAARIAARVIRSLAGPLPTGSVIQVETLRHMADEIEEGAS